MAYVTVPKDFTRVKSKVVFGLTKRQLICFGAALLVGVPLFLLIRGRVPTSAAALLMVFVMLPGFLMALYERHGQPLEVVVWQTPATITNNADLTLSAKRYCETKPGPTCGT